MTKRVLVLGDIIADRYVRVVTERQASEAPLPVWDVVGIEYRLGGAANVAANLAAMGDDISVELAGMCDTRTYNQLRQFSIGTTNINLVDDQISKTRFVRDGIEELAAALIARVDDRKVWAQDAQERFNVFMLSLDLSEFDAVVISDYRMGTISPELAKKVCCNPAGLVVVDSKRSDLSCFRGASVLKLNADENAVQVAKREYVVSSIAKYTVVTKGAKGAEVTTYEPTKRLGGGSPTYRTSTLVVPTEDVRVVDVTGCGDTFTAALGYYLSTKSDDVFTAVKFANLCASKVVQKFGTSV